MLDVQGVKEACGSLPTTFLEGATENLIIFQWPLLSALVFLGSAIIAASLFWWMVLPAVPALFNLIAI